MTITLPAHIAADRDATVTSGDSASEARLSRSRRLALAGAQLSHANRLFFLVGQPSPQFPAESFEFLNSCLEFGNPALLALPMSSLPEGSVSVFYYNPQIHLPH